MLRTHTPASRKLTAISRAAAEAPSRTGRGQSLPGPCLPGLTVVRENDWPQPCSLRERLQLPAGRGSLRDPELTSSRVLRQSPLTSRRGVGHALVAAFSGALSLPLAGLSGWGRPAAGSPRGATRLGALGERGARVSQGGRAASAPLRPSAPRFPALTGARRQKARARSQPRRGTRVPCPLPPHPSSTNFPGKR